MATMSERSRSLAKRMTATTMRPRTAAVERSIGGLFHGGVALCVSAALRLRLELKTGYHLALMSCRKGKSKVKPKPGRYRCTDCGAVVKKKGDVCEPQKVKKKD